VQLKRAYARPSPEDGVRVLVDRLWPRGLRKSEAAIDRWDPSRWVEFRRRYKAELAHKTELLSELRKSCETIRSRSPLRLATSCITRPSFSGTFLQLNWSVGDADSSCDKAVQLSREGTNPRADSGLREFRPLSSARMRILVEMTSKKRSGKFSIHI
jgi:uncharacterized protein YeaO (DUF488 family)